MSLSCPHCGGEIGVIVVPGTGPFPGLSPPNQGSNQVSNPGSNGPQAGFDRGSKGSSAPKSRVYNQGYDQDFLEFWKVWPLQRGKRQAQEEFRRAKRRANLEQIMEGAKRYRDDPNRFDAFTQRATTWLHGDGWEDSPLPARIDNRRPDPPRPADPLSSADAIKELLHDQ